MRRALFIAPLLAILLALATNADQAFKKNPGSGAVGASDGLGTDGDKGDVTVGGSGTTLQIDADAVGASEIAGGAVIDEQAYEVVWITTADPPPLGSNVDCLTEGDSTTASAACSAGPSGGAGVASFFVQQSYRFWSTLTILEFSCFSGEGSAVPLTIGDQFDASLFTVNDSGTSPTLVTGTTLTFTEPDFSAAGAAYERVTGLSAATATTSGFMQVRWGNATDPAASNVTLRCKVRFTD